MAFVFIGIFVLHDVVVGVFFDYCRDILGVLSTFEYALRVFMFLNDMISVFYIVNGFTEIHLFTSFLYTFLDQSVLCGGCC